MEIILASGNKKKLNELIRILKPLNIKAISASEYGLDLSPIVESGNTFEENAKIKAEYVFNKTGKATIADDSGLMIDALNGEPGVFSARYAGENACDEDHMQKVLKKMENIEEKKRTAKFVCAICCILPEKKEFITKGECFGAIGLEQKGTNGMGYDPIFVLPNGKHMAELEKSEKDEISHRGKALKDLYCKLEKYIGAK